MNDPAASIPATGGTVASVVSERHLGRGPGRHRWRTSPLPTLTNNGGVTGLIINADGTLTVPAGVAAGTYTATYQICSLAAPTSCDTASTPITVAAPIVDAVNDPAANIPATGGTLRTVLTNDTVDGAPAVIGGNVSAPTLSNNGGLAGLILNADGTLTIPPGLTPGTYTATYQICSLAVPTSCDTAAVPITVNTASADLAVTKTNGVTAISAGGATVYTIAVTNNGPDAVTAATLSDTAPAGLTFGSWTCTSTGGATCPASGAGNVSATLSLPSGGSVTFLVNATVGLRRERHHHEYRHRVAPCRRHRSQRRQQHRQRHGRSHPGRRIDGRSVADEVERRHVADAWRNDRLHDRGRQRGAERGHRRDRHGHGPRRVGLQRLDLHGHLRQRVSRERQRQPRGRSQPARGRRAQRSPSMPR